MAVNAYTKYPEWANKLAQWFTNEDNQKLRFEMKNVGPANKAAAADDAVKKVPAIMAVMDQAQYGKLQRVGILTGMLRRSLAKKWRPVILIIQIFRR